jgi:gamma-butyrobetaine dioxygenase
VKGDHKSSYDPSWLRENCYTLKNKAKYVSPYKLWDNSLQNNLKSIEIDHDEIIDTESGLVKWLGAFTLYWNSNC